MKETVVKLKKDALVSGSGRRPVTNPKQAIASGLSDARKEGTKVPTKKNN